MYGYTRAPRVRTLRASSGLLYDVSQILFIPVRSYSLFPRRAPVVHTKITDFILHSLTWRYTLDSESDSYKKLYMKYY